MVLDGKSSQEDPVNVGVPQDSTLGRTHFLLSDKLLFQHGSELAGVNLDAK